MLSLKELNDEIYKLENKEYFNYDTCHKLATLYILRDHYNQIEQPKNVDTISTSKAPNLEIVKSVK